MLNVLLSFCHLLIFIAVGHLICIFQLEPMEDDENTKEREVKRQLLDKISHASGKLIYDLFQKVQQQEDDESRQTHLNKFLAKPLAPKNVTHKSKQHNRNSNITYTEEHKVSYGKSLLSFFTLKRQEHEPQKLMEEEWGGQDKKEFMELLTRTKKPKKSSQQGLKFEPDKEARNAARRQVTISIWDNLFYLDESDIFKGRPANISRNTPLTEFQGIKYDIDSETDYIDLCGEDLNDIDIDSDDSDDLSSPEKETFLVDDGYLSEYEKESQDSLQMSKCFVLKMTKWKFGAVEGDKEVDRSKEILCNIRVIAPWGDYLDIRKDINLCQVYPERLQEIRELCSKSETRGKLLESLMGSFSISEKQAGTFVSKHCNKKRRQRIYYYRLKQDQEENKKSITNREDDECSRLQGQESNCVVTELNTENSVPNGPRSEQELSQGVESRVFPRVKGQEESDG